MHTTPELLDEIKKQFKFSDYRIGKALGASPQVVSNWRHGRNAMGPEYAVKVAELIDWPEAYVLACVEAERETNPDVLKVWRAIADAFPRSAAAVALTIGAATLAAGMNLASPEILAYFSLLAWPDYTLCAIAIMALGLSLPLILARTWPRSALAV